MVMQRFRPRFFTPLAAVALAIGVGGCSLIPVETLQHALGDAANALTASSPPEDAAAATLSQVLPRIDSALLTLERSNRRYRRCRLVRLLISPPKIHNQVSTLISRCVPPRGLSLWKMAVPSRSRRHTVARSGTEYGLATLIARLLIQPNLLVRWSTPIFC